MDQLQFKTENFEGPLDVLLHLVSRHKMKIYEIQISVLIDQYLAFMGTLGPNELDPASEFVEMAARLVYIKSLALLPRQDEKEEQERELVGQLVEYQLCKQTAQKLRDMAQGIWLGVREPLDVELPQEYSEKNDPMRLLAAYMSLMGRSTRVLPPPVEDFEDIVAAPMVSVSSRVIRILRSLRKGSAKTLQDLFDNVQTKGEAVATFLGVLELVKLGRMTMDDQGGITLSARAAKEN